MVGQSHCTRWDGHLYKDQSVSSCLHLSPSWSTRSIYDSAYAYLYPWIKDMFLSYLDDIDIYLYVSTLIKKLLIKQLKDPEITRPRQIQDTII